MTKSRVKRHHHKVKDWVQHLPGKSSSRSSGEIYLDMSTMAAPTREAKANEESSFVE